MRVVVVDDDGAIRHGRAEWLRRAPEVASVTECDFEAALAYDWAGVDVAVVDAHDSRGTDVRNRLLPDSLKWERFLGARVVKAIRALSAETLIAVTSTQVRNNPLLSGRMHDEGADYVYGHWEVGEEYTFRNAVLHPEQGHAASPATPEQLIQAGWALDQSLSTPRPKFARTVDRLDMLDDEQVRQQLIHDAPIRRGDRVKHVRDDLAAKQTDDLQLRVGRDSRGKRQSVGKKRLSWINRMILGLDERDA